MTRLILFLILIMTIGCVPVLKSTKLDLKSSEPIPQNNAHSTNDSGVYYSLPKGKLKVTVTVTKQGASKAGSKNTKTTTSKDGNTTTISNTITASPTNTINNKAPSTSGASPNKSNQADNTVYLFTRDNLDRITQKYSKVCQKAITDDLEGYLDIEIFGKATFKTFLDSIFKGKGIQEPNKTICRQIITKYAKLPDRVNLSFKIETVYEPDPKYSYLLQYNHNIFSEDKYTIEVDEKGLLKKIDTSSEDKTGEIIVTIAQTVGKILTFAATGVPSFSPTEAQSIKDGRLEFIQYPEIFQVVIDPTDSKDMENLNNYLFRYGLIASIDLSPYRTSAPTASSNTTPNSNGSDTGEDAVLEEDLADLQNMPRICSGADTGVCYRPQVPYTFTITNVQNAKIGNIAGLGRIIQSETIYLPNDAPINSIDLNRAAFVTNVKNLTFKDGFLTSVESHKPSEALGFVKIPLDVATALISVPGEIFKLKIDYSSSQKDLLDVQKQKLDLQKLIIDAQNELEAAQNPESDDDSEGDSEDDTDTEIEIESE